MLPHQLSWLSLILSVFQLTPGGKAAQAGVGVGDWVLYIDGESTSSMTHIEAQNRIRACGDRLSLTLSRWDLWVLAWMEQTALLGAISRHHCFLLRAWQPLDESKGSAWLDEAWPGRQPSPVSHRAMSAVHGSPWVRAASLGYQCPSGGWAGSSTCLLIFSLAEPRTTWGSRRRYVLLLVLQRYLSLISGEGNHL